MTIGRELKWVGYVARMEEDRSAFRILTHKPTGKRLLERPKRRLGNNIKMGIKEIYQYEELIWFDPG